MNGRFRVVADTNVILAAFSGSDSSPNREFLRGVFESKFVLLLSEDVRAEYARKLIERGLSKETIVAFLSSLDDFAWPVMILGISENVFKVIFKNHKLIFLIR